MSRQKATIMPKHRALPPVMPPSTYLSPRRRTAGCTLEAASLSSSSLSKDTACKDRLRMCDAAARAGKGLHISGLKMMNQFCSRPCLTVHELYLAQTMWCSRRLCTTTNGPCDVGLQAVRTLWLRPRDCPSLAALHGAALSFAVRGNPVPTNLAALQVLAGRTR